jgi:spermidine synthase
LRMKTRTFLKDLRAKLGEGGVVAFNLNLHKGVLSDINAVRKAFPHIDTFHVPGSKNLVVVAATTTEKAKPSVLRQRAKDLDRRFKANFSFQALLKN